MDCAKSGGADTAAGSDVASCRRWGARWRTHLVGEIQPVLRQLAGEGLGRLEWDEMTRPVEDVDGCLRDEGFQVLTQYIDGFDDVAASRDDGRVDQDALCGRRDVLGNAVTVTQCVDLSDSRSSPQQMV